MGIDRSGVIQEATVAGSGGQADGLFLIAHDTARDRVRILMIPRDTMTEITLTDLSGNVLGRDVQHLTLAYAYGDGKEKSCGYMEEAVSGLLCGLSIDWYMAADLSIIPVLNDEAGGVTVTIPVEGMERRDPALGKGRTVTLTGKQAEIYVRYRDTGVDHSALYRMDQQQEYIEGFFRAMKETAAGDDGLVLRMYDRVREYTVTDMPKDVLLKAALDALGSVTLDDGDFYTVPGEGVTTDRYDEFHVDQEALTQVILELFYREQG